MVIWLVAVRMQAGVCRRHYGQEAGGNDHHCHQQQQTMAQEAQRVLSAAGFHVRGQT